MIPAMMYPSTTGCRSRWKITITTAATIMTVAKSWRNASCIVWAGMYRSMRQMEGRERIDGVLRGPVREHEAGRDYRRLGVPLRRLEERLEGSRRQLDVLVGGGEPLAARSVGSQVGRLRKAEVLGRRHQVHPRELALDHLRRAVCRGVVDYPCLREPCVHLRLDRAEACRQEIVRVRVHDRDGDRGFAHAVSLGALESRSRRRIRGSDAGTLAAR